jgi:MFS family permease
VYFILEGVTNSFDSTFLLEIAANLDKAEEEVKWLNILNNGFVLCVGPIAAFLISHLGSRVVVISGLVVTAAMYVLTALTSNFWIMIFSYGVIGGMATGCVFFAALILITEYFDKWRGIATGFIMVGCSGVGSLVITPLISFIIRLSDWRFAMCICAGIIMLACVFGMLGRPRNPTACSLLTSQQSLNKVELQKLKSEDDVNNNEDIIELQDTISKNEPCNRFFVVFRETYNLWKNFELKVIFFSQFCFSFGFFTPVKSVNSMVKARIDKSNATMNPFIMTVNGDMDNLSNDIVYSAILIIGE